MSNIFSDFFTGLNNPKIEEMLSKTRDVAETVGKKSAEHLELSRKRVEYLDVKSKLSKHYEKFGQLQYNLHMGEQVEQAELDALAETITASKNKLTQLEDEIEAAKAKFSEAMQHTKETIQKEMEKASAPKVNTEVDMTEFFEEDDAE